MKSKGEQLLDNLAKDLDGHLVKLSDENMRLQGRIDKYRSLMGACRESKTWLQVDALLKDFEKI